MAEARLTEPRVFLRPIANPMALGFMGVAVASLVDSGLNLTWFKPTEIHQAALVILVFAPVTQILASIFGYLSRDPIASTGMGLQAGAWLCIGLLLITSPPGSVSSVLGTFLFAAGAGLLLVAFVGLPNKPVAGLVMLLTGSRWIIEGLYETSANTTWDHISGVVGLVVVAVALAAALKIELTSERIRRDGSVHEEAGVRSQL